MPRYDFVSPGAAAQNALVQFLAQRQEEERQAMLDQFLREREASDVSARNQELELRRQQEGRIASRQAQIDQQAEDDRLAAQRDRTNQINVRGMMADGMAEGLTPDKAKTIGIMAYREGMEAPPEVQQMQAEEEDARKRSAGLADYEARKMVDASVDAQGGERYRTVGGSIFDTDTQRFMTPPEQGGGGGGRGTSPSGGTGGNDASTEYGIQTADRVIAAIDGVLPKINERTAGIVGNATTRLGINQGGIDVSAELQTVAGNIAFNALQQIRAASKTGGALGNVANQELQLLQSVEGSLRQDQSPANLKAQLEKVRQSMERFKVAQTKLGGGGGNADPLGLRQ